MVSNSPKGRQDVTETTKQTHKIGNLTVHTARPDARNQWIGLVQGKDVIAISIDQAREMAAVIDEV